MLSFYALCERNKCLTAQTVHHSYLGRSFVVISNNERLFSDVLSTAEIMLSRKTSEESVRRQLWPDLRHCRSGCLGRLMKITKNAVTKATHPRFEPNMLRIQISRYTAVVTCSVSRLVGCYVIRVSYSVKSKEIFGSISIRGR
jgi:hypothetical protein